jgi:hypothetical protein
VEILVEDFYGGANRVAVIDYFKTQLCPLKNVTQDENVVE